MRKMSVLQLILSGAMLLAVHCAEWGFEFDHPLDDKGTNYKPPCTITFNANGGSGSVPSIDTRVSFNVTLPDGSGLSKSGYTFDGWNTNYSGNGTNYDAGSTYTPDGEVTLYAQWAVVTYAIYYDLGGGAVSSDNPTSYTVETPDFTLINPSKDYYTFVGWTESNGSTAPQTGVTIARGSIGDRSYTAHWRSVDTPDPCEANPTPDCPNYCTVYPQAQGCVAQPDTYIITFYANGGTVSPTSGTTGADGRLASLPTPTRGGYRFDGWYTGMTGGTQVTASTVYSSNTTIYARWTEIITYVEKGNDIKNYRTVRIGNQTWMAENLDYNVEGSKCYNNSPDSCAKYGRLYNWATAMDISASYDSSSWNGSDVKHRGVCPEGWHLPSDAEWTELTNYVGSSTAGTKLKSTSGWYSNYGTDEYGFSALPGGGGYSGGVFNYVGSRGIWWSATQGGASYAWNRYMYYDGESVIRDGSGKTQMFSVRCVQDP